MIAESGCRFMRMAFCCLLVFAGGLVSVFGARTSPSPIFINADPLQPPEVAPQVDAVIFWNRSLFVVTNDFLLPFDPAARLTPYEAKSVVFWTNNGTMVGLPGFKFEMLPERSHLTAAQRRRRGATLPKPSAVFYNDGEITVSDYLLVHASHLQSPGLFAGDIRSRMRFNVTNGLADFSRGAVHVGDLPQPLCTTVSNFIFGPFFFGLDPTVSYAYLDSGTSGSVGTNRSPLFLPTVTQSNFFFGALFAPPNPRPPFSEFRQFVGTNFVTNTLFTLQSCGSYDAFVHLQTNVTFFATNIFGTNFFVRDRTVNVVFVPTNGLSTNVTIGIAFPTNGLTDAPIVEFRSAYFDVIEQRQTTNFVTFRDDGASIFRGHDCEFDQFAPPNAPFSANLFYDPRFETNFVDYFYTVAQAQVGETNSIFFTNTTTTGGTLFPPLGTSLAASNPTNRPGTVQIDARDLDLSNARLRAENGIFIRATNLVGNANSFIDAPFVTFEAGAASGRLVISNLAQAQVNRVQANFNSWAGSWSLRETNGYFTNTIVTTNGLTNIVIPILEPVSFHVLILGACVDALHPSIIHDLTLRATNVIIQDQLAVNQSFLVQGQSLTFGSNSSLMLPRGASLAFTNVQNVTSFTNDGVLNIPDGAYFGAFEDGFVQPRQRRRRRNAVPRLVTYENFVNHGTISGASVSARAAYVENVGRPFAPAVVTATNGAVKLDGAVLVISNANITATSDIRLTAGDALIARSALTAGATNGGRFMNVFLPGALIIDATNSLTDGGVSASNDWRVTTGVRLTRRPQPIDPDSPIGDLMGTRIVVRSGTFGQSVIQWAGEDRGATVDGFADNLALGRLVLDGALGNLFHFQSAEAHNAIYVDYLELLNSATNYNFAVGVDPDFTIYFADSNISPEKLEEVGAGRIRWVSDFTGPQSSTNLVYPDGSVHTFNAGVVRSRDRDDDNDGLVNAIDCTPIPVPGIDTTLPCPVMSPLASAKVFSAQDVGLAIALSPAGNEVILDWDASANSVNTVEFSDSIAGGTWHTLTNFVNGPVNARVTVKDAAGAPLRVYRVRVDAGNP